jgi:hypothetical protein
MVMPVSALAAAPWLLASSADDTMNYIHGGPMGSLAKLVGLNIGAAVLLLIGFVILANQSPHESIRSFKNSAGPSFAYGLLVFMAGGWLLGIPGIFDYGRIRIGFLIISSTCLVITGGLLEIFSRRRSSRRDHASMQQAGPAEPEGRHHRIS